MVIEPKTPGYTQDLPPYDFSEGFGIMKIEKEDDTIVRVFVDKNGEILGGLEFNIAYPFSEGLAYADGGYIDQTGRYVLTEADLPPDSRFSRGGFSEGLVAVNIQGKIGFVNKKGEIVIEPQFDDVYESDFKDGLAEVEKDGLKTYIDKEGNIIWQDNISN